MNKNVKTLRLILGDQLNEAHPWLETVDEEVVYCLLETRSETTYVRHHIQKVVAFFLAMRHFAQALQDKEHRVIYRTLGEQPQCSSITDHIAELLQQTAASRFEYQLPDEYRLDEELKNFCEKLSIPSEAYDTAHFLSDRQAVARQFAGKKTYLMETFYREMRRRHHILMEEDGSPLTGQWNYDGDNRKKLPDTVQIPPQRSFERDVTDVVALMEQQGIATIGRLDASKFNMPVTRAEGLEVLADFCKNRLAHFGDYQDALSDRDHFLFHARVSFVMNVKLLSPLEVVNAVIEHWKANQNSVSFNQVEGFVRQIVGWREYMRGVYWAQMPGYRRSNYFNHGAVLPEWYWTGETKMYCLSHAINQSLDTAYAHHIQRLMVTGNFALLLGVHPDEVDAWYLGIYADALEWVEITNTRGMSQWADGGLLATKPYVSSANYIHKMGDHCKQCHYNYKEKTGEYACPFNSLYWDFLDRHTDKLASNFRMKMVYNVWSKFDSATQTAILERADWVKQNINSL